MLDAPASLVRTMTEIHGDEGRAWLGRLPAILSACEQRWEVRLAEPFPDPTYNYAAPATRADGSPAVLKACFPSIAVRREVDALRLFAGQGAVRLLDVDVEQGVFLLERLQPGTPLWSVDGDEQAIAVAVDVMRRLWRPAPTEHVFPTVLDWADGFVRLRQRFDGGCGPLPAPLVERAERLYRELADSMATPMLLHADLNFGNILAAEREPWLAIDPQGLIAEPAYETGVLLRDHVPDLLLGPRPGRLLERRIAQLSELLGFDRARLRDWGLAQAVLSAWWSIEDHGRDWESATACAQLLSEIKVAG